ncbi:hypothetical protein FRC18_010066 [Serendipita sp. 400]|nr:hypothetical protein FRC18_010066 [Serendipita sp. 400]
MSVAPTQDAIVLFGDSITQGGWEAGGFAQKLAYSYGRKMDVINRGFGGYNTEWALPIFEKMFTKKENHSAYQKCKLLTIWFGANDACLSFSRQHVPLARYKENLQWMVRSLREQDSEYYSPSTRIIFITPPPIQEDRWAGLLADRDPPQEKDRTWEHTKAYVEAVKETANDLNVPYVDAWDALWRAAGEQQPALNMFMTDGLHLTKEGYEIVYNELIDVIARAYPELHPDNLPQVFPAWDSVDPRDPRATVVSHYVDV